LELESAKAISNICVDVRFQALSRHRAVPQGGPLLTHSGHIEGGSTRYFWYRKRKRNYDRLTASKLRCCVTPPTRRCSTWPSGLAISRSKRRTTPTTSPRYLR